MAGAKSVYDRLEHEGILMSEGDSDYESNEDYCHGTALGGYVLYGLMPSLGI